MTQQPERSYSPAHYPQSTNGFAVASLVLGILFIGGLGSVLALVFGYIAKNQIDQSAGSEGGRGMAIAGIVLGWIGLAGIVLMILLMVSGTLFMSPGSMGV
ncbi:DUF4190 domain-containing protein [Haloechinothrix halophila]|uniref:DUF4190 domain-containing protein n=1 Tax=Haloechinothrix halophila TaxID=1069073 RepID=UPI0003FAD4FB|nr:DUF4190 domain-containing protein [Haloechinothrix halophila]